MSWKSGAAFGEDFWAEIRDYIPKQKRPKLAAWLMEFLEEGDAEFYNDSVLLRDSIPEVG